MVLDPGSDSSEPRAASLRVSDFPEPCPLGVSSSWKGPGKGEVRSHLLSTQLGGHILRKVWTHGCCGFKMSLVLTNDANRNSRGS